MNGIQKISSDMDEDDEIDLRELFKVLWGGKIWVGCITIIAGTLAVAYALSLPDVYKSEALLAPASMDGGSLGGMAKQYGGLASLAGISLPGAGGESKAALALEVIKSRSFVSNFIQRHDVLVPLMAANGWDPLSGELIIDLSIYDPSKSKWVREVRSPHQAKPSMQEAYKEFDKLLSINEDKTSSFVSISIKHFSPVVAQQWVAWIIEDINTTLRSQEIAEAENSIAYLKTQVESTSLSELQSRFFEMIQSQTETIMLAKVRQEYVFKTIDPAVVSEEKDEPARAAICILGALLGGVFSVLFVLIKHYTRKRTDVS
jgi:LPS O-antigen subunit length determinant protein (WzzB/FepE family)